MALWRTFLPISLTLASFILLLHSHPTHAADITWPEYNQQCRDDAGPPFPDDDENFPNGGKYHDGSAATPVLLSNGSCPPPLQSACSSRPSYKTAFLEGPISCGDKGWYCRILKEDGWPNVNLVGDYNFGHCNSTENFDDAGRDKDGHCHGSSHDNTYYWWIRDHWHRAYNGRLRCCCGWYAGSSSTPLTDGRIANRCDYRRMVTQEEDLSACRDANEDHGLSYEGGCDSSYTNQIGSPIPEDDSICWEISKFGYSEGPPVDGPTATPTKSLSPSSSNDNPVSSPTASPSLSLSPSGNFNDNDEEEDDDDYYNDEEEDPDAIFVWKRNNKKKLLKQTCGWLQTRKWKQKKNFCTLPKFNLYIEGQQRPASQVCFETCAKFCVKEGKKKKFYAGERVVDGETVTKKRTCKFLANQDSATRNEYCNPEFPVNVETVFVPASEICTDTCDSCSSSPSANIFDAE